MKLNVFKQVFIHFFSFYQSAYRFQILYLSSLSLKYITISLPIFLSLTLVSLRMAQFASLPGQFHSALTPFSVLLTLNTPIFYYIYIIEACNNFFEVFMPSITIQSLELTTKQKEIVAEKFGTIFSEVSNVPKDRIFIFFDGYTLDNAAVNGTLFSKAPPKAARGKFNESEWGEE